MLISRFGAVEPTDAQMFVVTGWASLTDQQKGGPMQIRHVASRTDMAAASVARAAEPRFVVAGVVSLAQLKEQVAQLEKARHGQIKCLAEQGLFADHAVPSAPAAPASTPAADTPSEGLAAE